MPTRVQSTADATAEMRHHAGRAVAVCAGPWRIGKTPDPAGCERALAEGRPSALTFDLGAVSEWDSSLVVHVLRLIDAAERAGIETRLDSLPDNIRRLVALARAVPEGATGRDDGMGEGLLARIGQRAIGLHRSTLDVLEFVGQTTAGFLRLLTGRVGFRMKDFWVLVQQCGSDALRIAGLIAVLVGLILAFVGAIQLLKFGAEIYVADLVGIAMVREMGALMTGIIMAGRSGAAFAATIGTMQVNEEVDALTTLGLDPIDFLVVPRALALMLMMPLLCLYADALGILGGLVIGVFMLDLPPIQYWNETRSIVTMTQVNIGVVKAAVFGAIVAMSGCYYGIRAGRNAAAVGQATTSAVVVAIVYIVIADAAFAVVLNALKI